MLRPQLAAPRLRVHCYSKSPITGDPPAKSHSLILLAFTRYFLKQTWETTIGERSSTSQKPYRLGFLTIPCLAFYISLGRRLHETVAPGMSGSRSGEAGSPACSLWEAVGLGGFHFPYAISAHSWAGTTAFQSAFSLASVLFGKSWEAGSRLRDITAAVLQPRPQPWESACCATHVNTCWKGFPSHSIPC